MLSQILYLKKDKKKDVALIKVNKVNGNIILNITQLENIDIDKNKFDDYVSKHYAFIISKIFIHELFGHKKSSFSKVDINFNSVVTFKNEFGELKFIDSDDKNIYKNAYEIENENNNISNIKGDSGYFIEYFLGTINGEYMIAIIDNIENKTNLCKLLDHKLWHQKISILKEYVKLKSIFLDLYPEIIINNNLTIYEQIELMKSKLDEMNKKSYAKESNANANIKTDLNTRIDEKFNNIWKKRRRKVMISKGKDIPSLKKCDKKKVINKVKESLYAGFTHGFYRK